MDYLSLFLLAFGLSLDDFALAFALCLLFPNTTSKNRFIFTIKIAIAFSLSTAILPLLGWLIGITIFDFLIEFSAWIILIIFCGVGIWIIKEAFEEEPAKWKTKNITSFWVLFTMGILSSIDEGATGIVFPFLDIPIYIIIIVIVIVNTILIFIASYISNFTTSWNQKITTVISGLILIVLGIFNWVEIFF